MENQSSSRDDTKKLLRSLLISSKQGVPLYRLRKDYEDQTCSPLDVDKMGYRNVREMLQDMPDVARIVWKNEEAVVFGVADESTQHIQYLVSQQRVGNKVKSVARGTNYRPAYIQRGLRPSYFPPRQRGFHGPYPYRGQFQARTPSFPKIVAQLKPCIESHGDAMNEYVNNNSDDEVPEERSRENVQDYHKNSSSNSFGNSCYDFSDNDLSVSDDDDGDDDDRGITLSTLSVGNASGNELATNIHAANSLKENATSDYVSGSSVPDSRDFSSTYTHSIASDWMNQSDDSEPTVNRQLSMMTDSECNVNRQLSMMTDSECNVNRQLSMMTDSEPNVNGQLSMMTDSESNVNRQLSMMTDSECNVNGQLSMMTDSESNVNGQLSMMTDSESNVNGQLSMMTDSEPNVNRQLSMMTDSESNVNGQLSMSGGVSRWCNNRNILKALSPRVNVPIKPRVLEVTPSSSANDHPTTSTSRTEDRSFQDDSSLEALTRHELNSATLTPWQHVVETPWQHVETPWQHVETPWQHEVETPWQHAEKTRSTRAQDVSSEEALINNDMYHVITSTNQNISLYPRINVFGATSSAVTNDSQALRNDEFACDDRLVRDNSGDDGKTVDQQVNLSSRVSIETQKNLRQLLSENPSGIFSRDLAHAYLDRYHCPLHYTHYGYQSVIGLAQALSNIVSIERPEPSGDWLLFDKQSHTPSNVPLAACNPRAVSMPNLTTGFSDVEDYIQEEVNNPDYFMPLDVVEPKCQFSYVKLPPLNETFTAYVSNICNPGLFWIQLDGDNTSRALESLMEKLVFYSSLDGDAYLLSPSLVTVEQICAVPYYEDNNWHRAVITKILDDGQVQVYYVDYGSTCSVNTQDLRMLKQEFFQLPAQAIKACLSGIKPKGMFWMEESRDMVLHHTSNRAMQAVCTAVDHGKLSLTLTCGILGGRLLNDILVSDGIAVHEGEDLANVSASVPVTAGTMNISVRRKRYVKRVDLTEDYHVHLLNFLNRPHLMSADISSLLWPTDRLCEFLAQNNIDVPQLLVKRDVYPTLFDELQNFGAFTKKASAPDVLTLFELPVVVQILTRVKLPSSSVKHALNELYDEFDASDPSWTVEVTTAVEQVSDTSINHPLPIPGTASVARPRSVPPSEVTDTSITSAKTPTPKHTSPPTFAQFLPKITIDHSPKDTKMSTTEFSSVDSSSYKDFDLNCLLLTRDSLRYKRKKLFEILAQESEISSGTLSDIQDTERKIKEVIHIIEKRNKQTKGVQLNDTTADSSVHQLQTQIWDKPVNAVRPQAQVAPETSPASTSSDLQSRRALTTEELAMLYSYRNSLHQESTHTVMPSQTMDPIYQASHTVLPSQTMDPIYQASHTVLPSQTMDPIYQASHTVLPSQTMDPIYQASHTVLPSQTMDPIYQASHTVLPSQTMDPIYQASHTVLPSQTMDPIYQASHTVLPSQTMDPIYQASHTVLPSQTMDPIYQGSHTVLPSQTMDPIYQGSHRVLPSQTMDPIYQASHRVLPSQTMDPIYQASHTVLPSQTMDPIYQTSHTVLPSQTMDPIYQASHTVLPSQTMDPVYQASHTVMPSQTMDPIYQASHTVLPSQTMDPIYQTSHTVLPSQTMDPIYQASHTVLPSQTMDPIYQASHTVLPSQTMDPVYQASHTVMPSQTMDPIYQASHTVLPSQTMDPIYQASHTVLPSQTMDPIYQASHTVLPSQTMDPIYQASHTVLPSQTMDPVYQASHTVLPSQTMDPVYQASHTVLPSQTMDPIYQASHTVLPSQTMDPIYRASHTVMPSQTMDPIYQTSHTPPTREQRHDPTNNRTSQVNDFNINPVSLSNPSSHLTDTDPHRVRQQFYERVHQLVAESSAQTDVQFLPSNSYERDNSFSMPSCEDQKQNSIPQSSSNYHHPQYTMQQYTMQQYTTGPNKLIQPINYNRPPYGSSQNPSKVLQQPSQQPLQQPSQQPLQHPSQQPLQHPSQQPLQQPSQQPLQQPSQQPLQQPSQQPLLQPSQQPLLQPSQQPLHQPSQQPLQQPSQQPLHQPSQQPLQQPLQQPSQQPLQQPSQQPLQQPSQLPSQQPLQQPSQQPLQQPSQQPLQQPSQQPLQQPSQQPLQQPSQLPSQQPLQQPSQQPLQQPSQLPSQQPLQQPSQQPLQQPSQQPLQQPSQQPLQQPSQQPLQQPSQQPLQQQSQQPLQQPSPQPLQQPMTYDLAESLGNMSVVTNQNEGISRSQMKELKALMKQMGVRDDFTWMTDD